MLLQAAVPRVAGRIYKGRAETSGDDFAPEGIGHGVCTAPLGCLQLDELVRMECGRGVPTLLL